MIKQLERYVTLSFLLGLVTVIVAIALAGFHTKQQDAAQRLVTHTNDILAEFEGTLANLNEAESSERGYALTGVEALLLPFERASALAEQHVARAAMLAPADSEQRQRIDALSLAVEQELAAMRSVINLRRLRGMSVAANAIAVNADDVRIETIRDSVKALERDEKRLLEQRRRVLDLTGQRLSWTVTGLGVTSLLILLLAFMSARSARRRQRAAEGRIADVNAQLRSRIEELLWREREAAGLQQLGDALQLVHTSAEAYAAIAQVIPPLLGAWSPGGILAVKRGPDEMHVVTRWGCLHGAARDDVFGPDACCALRGGRTYTAFAGEARLRCEHVPAEDGDYVCLPLAAHGETFGVLHVGLTSSPDTAPDMDADSATDQRRLSETGTLRQPLLGSRAQVLTLLARAAEMVAVALANVALRDRLTQQSIRDPLTGLFNRRYLEEALEREMARSARHGGALTVAMADVDFFKRINDRYGHDAGDEVLRTVAERMKAAVRQVDVVCRYGGEEFAIVLPEMPQEAARASLQRLLETCRRDPITFRGETIGPVTISAGVASRTTADASGAELLRRADGALYKAKREGRDRVVVAEDAAAIRTEVTTPALAGAAR